MEVKALTLGVLAERLGVPVHRAEYLVRSRQIKHVERAGHLRIFDEKAVEILQREIADQRRGSQ